MFAAIGRDYSDRAAEAIALQKTITSPGAGMGKSPSPIYLKRGDVMTLGSDRLGIRTRDAMQWSSARQAQA